MFGFVLWCQSVFPKSEFDCSHQRRHRTSEGIAGNAGLGLLGLAFGFGWEKGGWAS